MAKRRKPRGFSKRARSEHPGVTIAEEVRNGRKVIMLRWRDVLPGGKQGKRRSEVVKDDHGNPVTSRTRAHPYAVNKSVELAKEADELMGTDDSDDLKPDATWDELKAEHAAFIARKRRSRKSATAYTYSWGFVDSWRNRPTLPKKLTLKSLESLAAHVAKCGLSEASQGSILAHIRVILNYGRRRLRCVRLDAETLSDGLEPPRASVTPTVLETSRLLAILEASSNWDADHPESQTFALLAFLMLTGCRRGEAERLRWSASRANAQESWVDLEGRRLLIYSVKTKRQRTVPLGNRPMLIRLLKAMRKEVDTVAKPFVFGERFPLAIGDRRHEETVVEGPDGEPRKVRGKSLKRALTVVRKKSGADWAIKDLRSTYATYMANTLYGSALYRLAEENGHRPDVLIAKYAKQFTVPKRQASATTIEGVLGIKQKLEAWLKQRRRATR